MENFVDVNYLKRYCPELDRYKWSDQSDFTGAISNAEIEVFNYFGNAYRLRSLRPQLVLRDFSVVTTPTIEAGVTEVLKINRLRFVIKIASVTSTATIKLQGSNDGSVWDDITLFTNAGASAASVSVSSTVTQSFTIKSLYKQYRVNLTSVTSVSYRAYLIETVFDDLFAYKALYLIFANAHKGDISLLEKRDEFGKMYDNKIQHLRFYYDENDDGSLAEDEASKISNIEILG